MTNFLLVDSNHNESIQIMFPHKNHIT